MRYIFTTLVNISALSVNIPGMMDGMTISIVSGIFCAVCLGSILTLDVLVWLNYI